MEATLIICAKFEQNRSWCRVNFPFWRAACPGMPHARGILCGIHFVHEIHVPWLILDVPLYFRRVVMDP